MKQNKYLNSIDKDIVKFFSLHFIIIFSVISANIISDTILSAFLYLLSIFLCFSSFYLFYKICIKLIKKTQDEVELEVLSTQKQIQNEHFFAIEANKQNLLKIQNTIYNDMNNDIDINSDKTRELIDKYINELRITYCQNKVVDAILYHKKALAQAKKIKIDIQASIPQDLNIEHIDLMFIFNNLLDNAIEACSFLPENERFIQMTALIKTNFLLVKIINAKSNEAKIKDDTSFTTKANTKEHGLGLQIINKVCQKYNGNFSIDDKVSTVEVKVMLECKAN